jgi:hypothetical protein
VLPAQKVDKNGVVGVNETPNKIVQLGIRQMHVGSPNIISTEANLSVLPITIPGRAKRE